MLVVLIFYCRSFANPDATLLDAQPEIHDYTMVRLLMTRQILIEAQAHPMRNETDAGAARTRLRKGMNRFYKYLL